MADLNGNEGGNETLKRLHSLKPSKSISLPQIHSLKRLFLLGVGDFIIWFWGNGLAVYLYFGELISFGQSFP